MTRKFVTLSLIAAVGALIYISARGQRAEQPTFISPVYAAANFTAVQGTLQGTPVGEVRMGDQVIFRIRTSAGGYTPYQRAQSVADRLNALDDTLKSEDITTGYVNGQQVVMAKKQIVVTADVAHARLNGTTSTALASLWAKRLENAVTGTAVADAPVSEKVVPILSIGSGTRVGGALVEGTSDKLAQVVAVAQVEGQFGNAVRVRILVPVSTENVVSNIRRVPGTSVAGLVDIKL